MSVREKVERLIDRSEESGDIRTLTQQCEMLDLSRSSIYYTPRTISPVTLEVMHRIDQIHTAWPTYGQRTIAAQLTRESGKAVGRDWVRRLMKEMGIEAVYQKPNLSKNGKENTVFPYLLRNIVPEHPNQVWSTDITYVRMKGSFVYVVAFLDWFSRFVLSWRLSTTLDIAFVLDAAKQALEQYGNPDYTNSDQGSHFTSQQYINIWNQDKTHISMDGKNRCMDNILMERFWRSLKYEEVYLKDYATALEAEQNIADYISRYNMQRLHQSLGYRTPYEVYYKQ